MSFVFKRMPRYWGQIKGLIPQEKLMTLVAEDQTKKQSIATV
jgi:hypothetical protein